MTKSEGRKGKICLLVGTRKGAFVFTSGPNRRSWKVSGPHLKGNEVYHMAYDGRSGAILASVVSGHWGPTVARSEDMGDSWKESRNPPRFPKGTGLSVERLWHIRPGTEDDPGVVYAGVEPACLFKSKVSGKSWEVNRALLNHKTRKKWQPGGGGLCLHTIIVNDKRPGRMHIAISAVGTIRTVDYGERWWFENRNVIVDYQPEKYPEYGTCVHKLAINPTTPDVIYQQNHTGVYRSDDAGDSWVDIRNNLPTRFGFPVAADANDPKRAYLAPHEGDFSRIPKDGHFAVWGTDNRGKEWFKLDEGLPAKSYYTVLRDGMVSDMEDPCGLYFGTTTGHLFSSRDQGNHWERISDCLPPILSVNVSTA